MSGAVSMHQTPCDPQLFALLVQVVRAGASDLHLLAGYPPTLRVHGKLHALAAEPVSGEQIGGMMTSTMHAAAVQRFEREQNVDFAIAADIDGQAARFRANL